MKQKHKNKFTDLELLEAYKETPKLGILSVKFGVPNSTIFRRATKLGLAFENGGRNFKFKTEDILNGKHPQYPTVKLKERLLKEKLLENKCTICKIENWQNKKLVMHLDHIDGDSHNHLFSNLRMLCPNCHSQTSTYCGRNK